MKTHANDLIEMIQAVARLLPLPFRADFEVAILKLLGHKVEAIQAQTYVSLCMLYIQVVPAVSAATEAKQAVEMSGKLVGEVASIAGEAMVHRLETFNLQVLPTLKGNITALAAASSALRRKTITWFTLLALAICTPIVLIAGLSWGMYRGYENGLRQGASEMSKDADTREAITRLKAWNMGLVWRETATLDDKAEPWRVLSVTNTNNPKTYVGKDGAVAIAIQPSSVLQPLPHQ